MSQVGTKLFMPFYVETILLLLIGTYDLTTVLMDNGEKCDFPKQISLNERTLLLITRNIRTRVGFKILEKVSYTTLSTALSRRNKR